MLGESIVLGLAGGVLGAVLARLAISLLKYFGPSSIPRLELVTMDWRVLLFALAISLASGILFGLVPALGATRSDLNEVMAEGGRAGTGSRAGRWLRDALVVVEIAVALVVLIGAGLLLRSFVRLRATELGFGSHNVLTYRLPMAGGRNATPVRATAFLDQVLAHIEGLPGVRAAAAVNALPLTGLGTGVIFTVDGRPAPPPGERPMVLTRFVTRDYFHAMAIPLEAGREFADTDNAEAPRVVVINRTMAHRFWPDTSPLAERVVMETVPPRTAQVVGVVGDVKPDRVERDDWPTIYAPFAQMPSATMVLVARTEPPPETLAASIERRVHDLDPDQPLAERRTMAQIVDRAVAGARFNTVLLTGFGLVAFALATVGIYGVIAYDVRPPHPRACHLPRARRAPRLICCARSWARAPAWPLSEFSSAWRRRSLLTRLLALHALHRRAAAICDFCRRPGAAAPWWRWPRAYPRAPHPGARAFRRAAARIGHHDYPAKCREVLRSRIWPHLRAAAHQPRNQGGRVPHHHGSLGCRQIYFAQYSGHAGRRLDRGIRILGHPFTA